MTINNPKGGFDKDGNFVRPPTAFRSYVSSEPNSRYPPEAGRYHLYVSYACPWAHRTLIARHLKGLQDIISYTVVHYRWPMAKGWRFATQKEANEKEKMTPDPLHSDIKEVRELYEKADASFQGRWTVPVLWDKKTETIVSNESSEIIRMFFTAFDSLLPKSEIARPSFDLFPTGLRDQIEEAEAWHYNDINNGVYKSGLAKSQAAYSTAVRSLFESLDRVEAHLRYSGPYYLGGQLTEIDIRLYVTIIRFDPVYVQHFKCNIRDIRSGYPAIHKWLQNLYWNHEAFRETTNFNHIKRHYMESHLHINPLSIVAEGPIPHILPLGEGTITAREIHRECIRSVDEQFDGSAHQTKDMLAEQIHEITGIPLAALCGALLSQYTIAERLQWTKGRNTKKKEDKAYCLLSIFDVFMPLIYGKGDKTLRRLEIEVNSRSSLDHST